MKKNIFNDSDKLIMPADLLLDTRLDAIAFRVLAYIYRVCNLPNREFYRSQARIAADLGLTRQTVANRLQFLIYYGFVIQIGQDHKTHVFHLKVCSTCVKFASEAVNQINKHVNRIDSPLSFAILSKMMQFAT